MSTYVIAAVATALLFAAFAALSRRGCHDPDCGTHARCGACPNAPSAPEDHHA